MTIADIPKPSSRKTAGVTAPVFYLLTHFPMRHIHPRSRAIAALNDLARQSFQGCRIVLTEGLMTYPDADRLEILQKVRAYKGFSPQTDPFGEHDF